jgi:hypothetical protein
MQWRDIERFATRSFWRGFFCGACITLSIVGLIVVNVVIPAISKTCGQ